MFKEVSHLETINFPTRDGVVEVNQMWVVICKNRIVRHDVEPNDTGAHKGLNPSAFKRPVYSTLYEGNQLALYPLTLNRWNLNFHEEQYVYASCHLDKKNRTQRRNKELDTKQISALTYRGWEAAPTATVILNRVAAGKPLLQVSWKPCRGWEAAPTATVILNRVAAGKPLLQVSWKPCRGWEAAPTATVILNRVAAGKPLLQVSWKPCRGWEAAPTVEYNRRN